VIRYSFCIDVHKIRGEWPDVDDYIATRQATLVVGVSVGGIAYLITYDCTIPVNMRELAISKAIKSYKTVFMMRIRLILPVNTS
jgi:hypothetical protein